VRTPHLNHEFHIVGGLIKLVGILKSKIKLPPIIMTKELKWRRSIVDNASSNINWGRNNSRIETRES
jgi:hypothetical protein